MHVIRFQSGRFFQHASAKRGGPSTTTRRFSTSAEAWAFIDGDVYLAGARAEAVSLNACRLVVDVWQDGDRALARPVLRQEAER